MESCFLIYLQFQYRISSVIWLSRYLAIPLSACIYFPMFLSFGLMPLIWLFIAYIFSSNAVMSFPFGSILYLLKNFKTFFSIIFSTFLFMISEPLALKLNYFFFIIGKCYVVTNSPLSNYF